jgi:VanZ family protein
VESRSAGLTAGIAGLILYGSLFPFRFHSLAIPGGPFSALLATARILTDRGDVISNILLYLPFGFFGCLSARAMPPIARVLIASVAGVALSFGIEAAQFYDWGRVPSLADVCANAGGALLGAIAGIGSRRNPPFALLMVVSWIGARLLPYVPSLSLHKYEAALQTLNSAPGPGFLEVYKYFAFWLAAGLLLESLAGIERSRWATALLFGFVLLARIIIVDLSLSPAEVAGGLLGVAMWVLISRLHWRIRAIAIILVTFVVVDALRPFHFTAPRTFGWIPFLSFMQGPRESSSRVFLEKTFMYGAMVWLLKRSGMPLGATTWLATALVFSLRLLQVYLPGRSAEITDAIMILMLAGVMKLIGERSRDHAPA